MVVFNGGIRLGVDVGGTNTDICAIHEETGELMVYKLPSSVRDQSISVINGIKEISEIHGFPLSEIGLFIHGTTVATNAILEERGATTALLTTSGFRDLLDIGRQKRPDLYDLQADKKKALVPRNLRIDVNERVDYKGDIEKEIITDEVVSILRDLKEKDVGSVAVVFLNSFVNPQNEERVKFLVKRELPNVFLSISSEVSNQFREYERLCSTVLNAFVGPEVKKYLNNLKNTLEKIDIKKIYINHSNGGIMSVNDAVDFPIKTALSGPAAGVIGAQFMTHLIDCPNAITIDIGGTSTDISLITKGELTSSKDKEVSGFPTRIPSLDIETIGSGGGSIAWVDSGGVLKVGPKSAGADPGPACYDLGGTEATITDARVVLGHLNQKELLGGRLPISYKKAKAAVNKIADKLNMGLYETAKGIVLVGNSNIVRELKKVTVERGYNPIDFTLVAFGGAGPLHAAELMRELNISKAIIPKTPGLLAAYGLLTEDVRKDFVRTKIINLNKDSFSSINEMFNDLESKAFDWFEEENVEQNCRRLKYSLDMRYIGQNYEIEVEFERGKITNVTELERAFNTEYKKLYSTYYDAPIQIVNFNLSAIGGIDLPKIKKSSLQGTDSAKAVIGKREVYFDEDHAVNCEVYGRELLNPGNKIIGPAIIEQMDTTTIILPEQEGTIDEYFNLIITERKK